MGVHENWAIILAPHIEPCILAIPDLELGDRFAGMELTEVRLTSPPCFFDWDIDATSGAIVRLDFSDDTETGEFPGLLRGLAGVKVSDPSGGRITYIEITITDSDNVDYERSGVMDLFCGHVYSTAGDAVVLTVRMATD